MKAKDVMTKRVATCGLETNLAEAAALMWENNCGALPVLNAAGELAGIVTDRDLFIALGTRNARASKLFARDIVGGPALVCKGSTGLRAALQIMRESQIRRLPVVGDDGKLEGILSLSDLILTSGIDGSKESSVSPDEVIATMRAVYFRQGQLVCTAHAA